MSPIDFMCLPPAIRVIVEAMLWPAVWVGFLLTVALVRDLVRLVGSYYRRARAV